MKADRKRRNGVVRPVACPRLKIELDRRQCRIGGALLDEGNMLSLDGNTGAFHAGRLSSLTERPEKALAAIAQWRLAAPT